MTLVAAFATPEFAVMVADRRRTNMGNRAEFYDDCKKIRKLNAQVMVGHAGHYDLAEYIIRETWPLINPDDTVERVAAVYKGAIDSLMKQGQDDMELTFHIAGYGADGNIVLIRISEFESFEIKQILVQNGSIMWGLSVADYDATPWLQEQVGHLEETTPTGIEHMSRLLVEHVAAQDPYVSPDYDMITITRG